MGIYYRPLSVNINNNIHYIQAKVYVERKSYGDSSSYAQNSPSQPFMLAIEDTRVSHTLCRAICTGSLNSWTSASNGKWKRVVKVDGTTQSVRCILGRAGIMQGQFVRGQESGAGSMCGGGKAHPPPRTRDRRANSNTTTVIRRRSSSPRGIAVFPPLFSLFSFYFNCLFGFI